MLERTNEIGPLIGNPSTCLINLLSAKKVRPLYNLFNIFLKADFSQRLKLLYIQCISWLKWKSRHAGIWKCQYCFVPTNDTNTPITGHSAHRLLGKMETTDNQTTKTVTITFAWYFTFEKRLHKCGKWAGSDRTNHLFNKSMAKLFKTNFHAWLCSTLEYEPRGLMTKLDNVYKS